MMHLGRLWVFTLGLAILTATHATTLQTSDDGPYWMLVKAKGATERTQVANTGVAIEVIRDDYVAVIGSETERKHLQTQGLLLEATPLAQLRTSDFPSKDGAFHNYQELTDELKSLAHTNADFVQLDSIGTSVEGREIYRLRISTDLEQANQKPGILFLGGHHAREHLSVEVPLRLAKSLVEAYKAGDANIQRLVRGRDIHIIPLVNPDGAEFDVASGSYQFWRKNRSPSQKGTFGVDLNRNYGYQWGSVGASPNPKSDTYRGPEAFSEPETQAVRNFIEQQKNLSVLLTFHSFSQLILYPWGHSPDSISEERDFLVHKALAEKMAQWNGYEPMQASALYGASGDTTDWAYGVHRIISFTFELDPKDLFSGGFYPGADRIQTVFDKNWQPSLFLIDYADNPYRILEPTHAAFGLSSPLIQ